MGYHEGENVMVEELQAAIGILKRNEVAGPDQINTERLKALDEMNLKTLTSFCHIIHKQGGLSGDLNESVFIRLPQKVKATR